MALFGPPVPHTVFDPAELAALKQSDGQLVSVVLPARNEASTIGRIIETISDDLVERWGLVDEIVVIDDDSIDDTAFVALAAGAKVFNINEILPEEGPGAGKGNALWKSLHVTEGSLICFVDADVRNFPSHYVTGLLGPLLTDDVVGFTKAVYVRMLDGTPGEGGRVTELMARPLFSQLFPHLAPIVQPLSGEYAGRREVLETIPFVMGWGVETAMLIDIADQFGVESIAQVELGTRYHRNRPLHELGPQATAILYTALERAGLHNDEAKDLIRYDMDYVSQRIEIEVRERPAMNTVASYRSKFGYELSA